MYRNQWPDTNGMGGRMLPELVAGWLRNTQVCVLQDQFGFTLHHQVMQKQTDDQVTVPMAEDAKKRFPALNQVSYDKGFWSPDNLEKLEALLERPVLPKKGRLSASDKKRETHLEFIRAKRKHSAVESDINALESNGLDKCPDKGIVWWTPLSRQ